MSYKFSFDATGENKRALDILTEKMGVTYGFLINKIISSVCCMPEDVKKVFLDACESQCEYIDEQLISAGEYEAKTLKKKKGYYEEFARLINKGEDWNSDQKPKMTKYKLSDGCLVCPSDWIVLNPEIEGKVPYAGVVECRNSVKFGIPTFVFFTAYPDGSHYDNTYCNSINELCVKVWPKFQEIIDAQINPVPDPERKGFYLNQKEFLESPIIGYFSIFENGEIEDPPCGAVIVRDTQGES